MSSNCEENSEFDGLIRAFRSLEHRWPFANLGLLISPSVECTYPEIAERVPQFPHELFVEGIGQGTFGRRTPVVMASVHLVQEAVGDASFDEVIERVEAGRRIRVITKITGKEEDAPPGVRFRAQYFPVYDTRGLSDNEPIRSMQVQEVKMAWEAFAAGAREVRRLFVFDGRLPMGGLTHDGGFHDGRGTPQEWRDVVCWMNYLFQDRPCEELYETADGDPWFMSILSPGLGEASAVAVEKLLRTPQASYLGIILGDMTATREGVDVPAEFGRKQQPWRLFKHLVEAGPEGLPKDELRKLLGLETKDEAALRGHKGTVNGIVMYTLRVEIHADNRGIWKVTPLD